MKKKIIYIIYFGCVLFFLLFSIIIQILKNPVINEYSNIDEKLHNLNLTSLIIIVLKKKNAHRIYLYEFSFKRF